MEKTLLGSMESDIYIKERLDAYQAWYDKKSVKTKALYLRMRALSVVGAAIVPVFVNLSFSYVNYITTGISLIVVILVSLESVFHYREQWKNYRSTEQYLGREKFYYLTKEGPYKKLSENDAFILLVERVENAIASENAATLNTMTLTAEAKEVKKQS